MLRVIMLLGAGATLCPGQTISFLPPTVAITGGTSSAEFTCAKCLAIGDFNGDGKPDIVFSWMEFTPSIAVVLGNGDGTFGPTAYLPLNQPVGFPLVGDFNGDGKQDIVMSAGLLYLGKGDGSFQTSLAIPGCSVTLAADFNRDGKTDLLCGNAVMLSNGDGTFRSAGTAGTIAMSTVLLSADVNNDGVPDLILREISGQLAVVLGKGDGTFGSDQLIAAPMQNSPVLVGDFTGDGKPDIVGYPSRGAFLAVLPGAGDGTFGSPLQTSIAAIAFPGNLTAVADFNKDGKLDIVAGESVFAGNGDGTFRFPVFTGTVTQACSLQGEVDVPPIPCAYTHVSTLVADFNGDGLPDLAASNTIPTFTPRSYSALTVLLNDSPGDGFTTAGVSAASYTSPVAPDSFVAAFGSNLAPVTAAATMNPLPTTLGGIRLHIRDRSHTGDTLAPLLYVSATQINYLMTSNDPFAWVAIEHVGTPYIPKGIAVPITPFAPAFLGGLVLTLPNTISTLSIPIDLSGAPVYLTLYGTGFDQAVAAGSDCVAGVPLPLSYAGPQGQIPGLDQINVLLPTTLPRHTSLSVTCNLKAPDGTQGFLGPFSITIQ